MSTCLIEVHIIRGVWHQRGVLTCLLWVENSCIWSGQISFCIAESLVTDRPFIMRWAAVASRRSKFVVLNHLLLTLRNERLISLPYKWENALVIDYPIQVPAIAKGYHNPKVVISVHSSSKGHSNLRSISIKATLNETEERSRRVRQSDSDTHQNLEHKLARPARGLQGLF